MLKTYRGLITGLALTTLLSGCNQQATAEDTVKLDNETNKASYAIGIQMGSQMAPLKDLLNQNAIMMGFKDSIQGKEPQLSMEDMQAVMQSFQETVMEQQQAKQMEAAGANAEAGEKFLSENKSKEGVTTTESGLQYKVITEGSGASPAETDTVVTHYTGTLINGEVFDSSYKRNSPATFPVNGVIPGWTEALQMMKVGSKWKLFIPAELAYGEQGAGANIGPNEVLIFDIELLEIKDKGE
jgi:FKBP-type peptidyl-prolyl cis-trans isomerase